MTGTPGDRAAEAGPTAPERWEAWEAEDPEEFDADRLRAELASLLAWLDLQRPGTEPEALATASSWSFALYQDDSGTPADLDLAAGLLQRALADSGHATGRPEAGPAAAAARTPAPARPFGCPDTAAPAVIADPTAGPPGTARRAGAYWAVQRLQLGLIRLCQYGESSEPRLLDDAYAQFRAGLAAATSEPGSGPGSPGDAPNGPGDAVDDLGDEQIPADDLAYGCYLLALASRERHDRAPDDRRILDVAVTDHREALARQRPGSPEYGELAEALAGLLVDRCCLTADPGGTRDAEEAAGYYRAALRVRPDPDRRLGLADALLISGCAADTREPLDEAVAAYTAAIESAGPGASAAWLAHARSGLVHARAVLWSDRWRDAEQGALAEPDLLLLTAEPEALDALAPEQLDLFGRLLAERAAAGGSGELKERAVALLRAAVRRWDPDRDGSVLAPAYFLVMLQFSLAAQDPAPGTAPERQRDILTGTELLLALPDLDEAQRNLMTFLGYAARMRLAEQGLGEPLDGQELARTAEALEAIEAGGFDYAPDADLGDRRRLPRGDVQHDLFGNHRFLQNYERGFRHWQALPPGSPERVLLAQRMVVWLLAGTQYGAHMPAEWRDELLREALRGGGAPGHQAGLHGAAGLLHMLHDAASGGAGLHEAVRLTDRATAFLRDDPALRDQMRIYQIFAALQRGSTHEALDEVDDALADWLRLRESPHLTAEQRRALDAQVSPVAAQRAAQRGDAGAFDRCLDILTRIVLNTDPADLEWVELWAALEHLHAMDQGHAGDRRRPRRPLPAERPSPERLRLAAARLPPDHQAAVLASIGTDRSILALGAGDYEAHDAVVPLLETALELSDEGGDRWLFCAFNLGSGQAHHGLGKRDSERLSAGIDLLERAHRLLPGPESRWWGRIGLALGMFYRARAQLRGDGGPHGATWAQGATVQGDRRLGRRTGMRALRGFIWSALLQSGTQTAAEAAAAGVKGALEVADWCLEDGVPEEAVQALDACRGLVLHSATTSLSVPQRLRAAGRSDLAEEWRQAGNPGNDLRRRVLEALTGPERDRRPQGRLLDPPAPEEIGAALRETGADALVYLVPAAEDRRGAAVIVDAAGRTRACPLPLLRADAAPLLEYAPASAAGQRAPRAAGADVRAPGGGSTADGSTGPDPRSRAAESRSPGVGQAGGGSAESGSTGDRAAGGAARDGRWARDLGPIGPGGALAPGPPPLRDQLTRLGAWAWYAAVKPVLEALGADGSALTAAAGPAAPADTAHAARAAAGGQAAAGDGVAAGDSVAAGDRVAHAARAAAGGQAAPGGRVGAVTPPRVVLVPMGALGVVPWHAAWVAGPQGSRRYAVELAEFSYTASARLLCEVAGRGPVPRSDAALLVGNPTGDLQHAGQEARALGGSFYPAADFLGREATPDRVLSWLRSPLSTGGTLHLACHGTVTSQHRRSSWLSLAGGDLAAEALTAGDWAAGPRWELVVLAACRSNVSGRGHNEAYSLSTAFLVAGACSVVGSLWPVPDEATSLLMYMTHHYLRRRGEPPARALRAAQLWMLDPSRALPDDLPPELRSRAARIDPLDLSAWAGFTHLGR